jgi:hypothetical protein
MRRMVPACDILHPIGKFFVENDTLVPIKHEEGPGAGQQPPQQFDEDVNNKMFIVVRNLKSSTSKTVRPKMFNPVGYRTTG